MDKNNNKIIEIREIYNTYGCVARDVNNSEFYENSVGDLVPEWDISVHELPVDLGGGSYVSNLLELGTGEIVKTETGAYGGTKRTVRVSWSELENLENTQKNTKTPTCDNCGIECSHRMGNHLGNVCHECFDID